ncbi:MAG: 50S ribosomal protein L15 [Planctomycetes bacterium]|nr:50S ribosomal protein L15 [Planctomycetota bacterium]
MDLTEVRQLNSRRKSRKRVGRGSGSGSGKTSGRGHKGTKSRAGGNQQSIVREGGRMPLFRRLPKVGFNNANFTTRYVVVNVGDLEEYFQKGDVVDVPQLRKKRLVRGPGEINVKILGDGELTKSLTVKAGKFSKSAEAKIVSAGGSCEVV